jgi:hypothetical protein
MNKQSVAAMVIAAALWSAVPAAAQSADPNPGALTLTGSFDFLNAYFFRGIPQDEGDFGSVMWPAADLGIAIMSGDGALKSLGVNVGTWNSLHTGAMGLDGPSDQLWYESDFYTTLGLGFGGGTSLGLTYTAYTSPNGLFATVKEVSFKFAVDDSRYLGRASVKPYVIVARELGEDGGQADGGLSPGTYMELGAAPGFAASRLSVAVPVRVGLSLDNYYEGIDGDERFGFFSVAGIVTLPFSSQPTRFGSWNAHGGVEWLRLGESNQDFGENKVVYSLGIGFTY